MPINFRLEPSGLSGGISSIGTSEVSEVEIYETGYRFL